jgi:hypothetical protein
MLLPVLCGMHAQPTPATVLFAGIGGWCRLVRSFRRERERERERERLREREREGEREIERERESERERVKSIHVGLISFLNCRVVLL